MGKRNLKKIPSERIDEQIDFFLQRHHPDVQDPSTFRAVHDLEQYYAPHSDAMLPLERVRQRLKQHMAAQSVTQLASHPAAIEGRSQAVQERNTHMKEITPDPQKKGKEARFFGTLAAVLVITLLVGSLIWVFKASHNTQVVSPRTSSTPIAETPDVPGIYILSNLDANANEYAVLKLDIHTHAVSWSHPLGTADGVFGYPIFAAGDTVYAMFRQQNTNYLYALNALNGTLRWKLATDQYTAPGISGEQAAYNGSILQPFAAHGIVYLLAEDGSLVALDAATGKYLWTYTSQTANHDCSTVEVADGLAYGTCHNVIFALNARTGALKWSQSAASNQVFSSPVFGDGTIYLTSSEEDHHSVGETVSGGAYAYNATSGQLLWQHPIDNWAGTAPTVVDGVVYFGSYDHMIYGLRASDGVQVWRYDTGGVVDNVAVSNGVVYADQEGILQGDNGSGTPSFMAIQLSNSQQLWVKEDTTPSIDAIMGDVLYLDGGGVTILNGRTNTVIWHGNEAVYGIDVVL